MTFDKWTGAFTDVPSTNGSFIFASGFGRQLHAAGLDLALFFPHTLFMACKRINLGQALLQEKQEQKISGTYCKHQLQYNL